MQHIKYKEFLRISWQPRSERPFHYKSIQANEEGGGSDDKREQRDKETELKTKKRGKQGSTVKQREMGCGMKRHEIYRCSLVNHDSS